jgi:hypothetical protein
MCLFSKDFRKEIMLETNGVLTASLRCPNGLLDLLCIEMAVVNEEAVLDHRLPARVTATGIRSGNRDYIGLRSPRARCGCCNHHFREYHRDAVVGQLRQALCSRPIRRLCRWMILQPALRTGSSSRRMARAYLEAVEGAFGADIDYAMLVKLYGPAPEGERRYSPAECIGAVKTRNRRQPRIRNTSARHLPSGIT